ncbi:hypothetical protein QBC42DRAFT_200569 [Cladorrhinum samala]|uniref:Uncharacterized protein n=1 Tax=Cladorrhinum samala TaxID=585594 RepID=A0AAV9HSH6_9PEZI|nr:hypothetical protein QBC42DRAFT_200569 [Cladorrhinum samala]
MVMLIFFRIYFKRTERDEDDQQEQQQRQQQSQRTDSMVVHRRQQMNPSASNEKQTVPKARNWLFFFLTALRICQLGFAAFAHIVFLVLIYEAKWWLEDPSDKESYEANTPWARLLNSVTLIFHISAPVLFFLWRNTQARRWRFFAIFTCIGDVVSLWAFLIVLTLMNNTYEGYCDAHPRVFDYGRHGILAFLGKGASGSTYSDAQQQRHIICRSLHVVYWAGAFPAWSHIASAVMTWWYYGQIKTAESCEVETFPKIGDLEQAITRRLPAAPAPAAPSVVSRGSTPPPSPPPSYRSRAGSTATAGRPPSYARASMETMSSIDPDSFLVSDGWRGPDQQPPEYSSRPPSLRKGEQS